MMILKIIIIGFLMSGQAGCGTGPAPRLIDLVGDDAYEPGKPSVANHAWTRSPKMGLVVYSDATAQQAAPAIPVEFVETLARRTEDYLRQQCAIQEVVPIILNSPPGNFSQELKNLGNQLQLSHLFLVVLSSYERTGPEKFGEATMMTQMSGSVIENSALAEVGVLHVSPFNIVFLASGTGTESLEELDAPIGNPPLTNKATGRDHLRARAGQYALDRALERVRSACHSGATERTGVTGSFQIAGQARNPAL